MALTLTISGNGDVTNKLMAGSLTLQFNTLDFGLIDVGPYFGTVQLIDTVANINWTGSMVAIDGRPGPNKNSGHSFAACTAINTTPIPIPAPTNALFDLSDTPVDTTSFYEQESGAGHFLLEDGSGVFLTEGIYSKDEWANLDYQRQINLDSSATEHGTVTVFRHGLRVGDQILVSCLDLDAPWAGGPLGILGPTTIQRITTTWPAGIATYLVEFGANLLTFRGFFPPIY